MNPQPKRVPYRNQKIRDAAKGEDCTICGVNDDTIVFAHFDEQYAGKGMRQKADDCAGFFLCHACHDRHGKGFFRNCIDRNILIRAYYRTIRRLIDIGVLS